MFRHAEPSVEAVDEGDEDASPRESVFRDRGIDLRLDADLVHRGGGDRAGDEQQGNVDSLAQVKPLENDSR